MRKALSIWTGFKEPKIERKAFVPNEKQPSLLACEELLLFEVEETGFELLGNAEQVGRPPGPVVRFNPPGAQSKGKTEIVGARASRLPGVRRSAA